MKTFEQDDSSDDEPDSGHVTHVFVVAHQIEQTPVKIHKSSFKHFKCLLIILLQILCLSGQENGANRTKAFVKGFLGLEMNIVWRSKLLILQLPI